MIHAGSSLHLFFFQLCVYQIPELFILPGGKCGLDRPGEFPGFVPILFLDLGVCFAPGEPVCLDKLPKLLIDGAILFPGDIPGLSGAAIVYEIDILKRL